MWPGPRPTFVPNSILIHPAVLPQQTWAENWGCAPFLGWGAGSPSSTIWPGPRPTSMTSSGILIHPAPFGHNRPVPISVETQSPSPKTSAYGPNPPLQKLRPMGRSFWRGGLCPLFWEGAGSPYSTIWPGTRPIFIPSGILIHPAVWPQYRHGPKIGGSSAPFWGGRAGSPSNTMCLG